MKLPQPNFWVNRGSTLHLQAGVHSLALVGIMTLGIALRFWHLDFKPLWMDEVMTALLSFGRSYDDIPVNSFFSLEEIEKIFTLKSDVTCHQITQIVTTQSTHPPLFFCLMHQWLKVFSADSTASLAWKLRSLPAVFGVGAIAALYYLNRLVFSPTAGLVGATMMAVSPFAVYLSQEARHYTLPLLLVTLALLVLFQLLGDSSPQGRNQAILWLSWMVINIMGFYIHYLFILAFIPQILVLIEYRKELRFFPNLLLLLIPLILVPGFVKLIDYSHQDATNWLRLTSFFAPLYQTLVGWMIFTIALPVEKQSLGLQIVSVLCMMGFTVVLWKFIFQNLSQQILYQRSVKILIEFLCLVGLQFIFLIYILGRDITLAPRYNYVYFPIVCSLIGVAFSGRKLWTKKDITFCLSLLMVGTLSCIFLNYDLVFLKPFHPQRVAAEMNRTLQVPLVIAIAYRGFQEIALGLSFAIELRKVSENPGNTYLIFFSQTADKSVWQSLAQIPSFPQSSFKLWLLNPEFKQSDYPTSLSIASNEPRGCRLETMLDRNLGLSFPLYDCPF